MHAYLYHFEDTHNNSSHNLNLLSMHKEWSLCVLTFINIAKHSFIKMNGVGIGILFEKCSAFLNVIFQKIFVFKIELLNNKAVFHTI